MLSARAFSKSSIFFVTVQILVYIWGNVGAQRQNVNSRIVGGVTTTAAKHPHLLALFFDEEPICGSSLLSDTWVVTAAHCVKHHDTEPARFKVRGGTAYLTGNAGVTRQIEKIFVHHNYKPKSLNVDIAMLKLAEPMVGTNIKPVKLTAIAVPNNAVVSVSGWGYTQQGSGQRSNQLRTVQLKKISAAQCRKRYPKLTVNMICAEEPGKGKCSGDSGGPMLYKGALVGLVSGGFGCGKKDSPGLYANVLRLKQFITNTMNNN